VCETAGEIDRRVYKSIQLLGSSPRTLVPVDSAGGVALRSPGGLCLGTTKPYDLLLPVSRFAPEHLKDTKLVRK